MFAKSYKLKSNNTLKNSEKKHLVHRIQEEFSGATEENVRELVPIKSNSSCMKIILHSGDIVGVYVVDGVPIVIEDEKGLVPTICAVWKFPTLVPMLIIHTPVLSKVLGGAPLYLPGIVRGAPGNGWAEFSRGSPVAACTHDNQAAAIVGRATLSSREMVHLVAGICLETVQVYGDQLCKEVKFNRIERPKLGAATYPNEEVTELASDLTQLSVQPVKEEWPSLGPRRPAPATAVEPATSFAPAPASSLPINEPQIILDMSQDAPLDDADDSIPVLDDTMLTDSSQCLEDGLPSDMDGLLRWCLLSFLRLEGKRLQLPLKTNLLYKNHLMPMCPPDKTLDVKKSSYKKMSKFLDAMQQEGFLQVKEIEKGVSAVVVIDLAHAAITRHSVPAALRDRLREEPPPKEYEPPVVREMYCVTAAVQDLFLGHRKGTALTAGEVRAGVTQYVRERALRGAAGTVTLDATLAKLLGKQEQEVVKWEEVMNAATSKLTAATEMRFGDGSATLSKARLEPVTMNVASRAGNKKVTLVSNLEQFGFNLQALSHICQQGVAASCGVTRSPGSKYDQLMLQGDQTHFVAKLLIEKYGLPKKFVDGADKALKKKK